MGAGGKKLPVLPKGTQVGDLVMGEFGLYHPKRKAEQDYLMVPSQPPHPPTVVREGWCRRMRTRRPSGWGRSTAGTGPSSRSSSPSPSSSPPTVPPPSLPPPSSPHLDLPIAAMYLLVTNKDPLGLYTVKKKE